MEKYEQLSFFDMPTDLTIRQNEKQNANLTFKYNASLGRHGWLRLTPAYSVKIVEDIIKKLPYTPKCVFEPFSGTGTTELVCANLGIRAIANDINPFLVWFAHVKTRIYSIDTSGLLKDCAREIVNSLNRFMPCDYPPISHIERWWGEEQLLFLAQLKSAINSISYSVVSDLLKVAFCRILITVSNAAFNHVSTSFKQTDSTPSFDCESAKSLFISICDNIADTIGIQPIIEPVITHTDSTGRIENEFDTVITSPPYPNRISYIRELRPYMYWLDFLKTSDDASDLDWSTIGGTWGAATSKLATWTMKSAWLPTYLFDIAESIAQADNKSARLMANYVLKYFDDMALHFESVYKDMSECGSVHYIVGNSNFYGNTVPSERIYMDLMKHVGFNQTDFRIIRKRNCNKALYEYIVTGQKS